MNGISGWFRQFSAKLSAGLRGFMAGRYGTDRLNMVILCAGLVAYNFKGLLETAQRILGKFLKKKSV